MLKLNKTSNEKLNFYVKNLYFDNETINIFFEPSIMDMETMSKKSYIMELQNRKTKEIKSIILDSVNENNRNTLKAKLNVLEDILFFKNGIVDIYIKSKTNEQIYRVKSSFCEDFENEFYYLNETNEKLIVYTTVKGNLSIKITSVNNKAYIEKVNLSEDGKLSIEGYTLIPQWNIRDKNEISKELVFCLGDDEIEENIIPMKEIERKDITEKYKNIGSNFDWTGFSVDVNLYNNNMDKLINKLLDMKIRIKHENEIIILPINVENIKFTKETYVANEDGTSKIELRTLGKNKNLKLIINKFDKESQLITVYVYDELIEIKGYLPECCKDSINDLDTIHIVLKNRKSSEEITVKCELNENEFKCNLNIEQLKENEYFGNGIFDTFIEIDGVRYRLVNKLDGISNKQKIVNIPQIITNSLDNNAIAVKAYYTIDEELSLLVRNYIRIKKINIVKKTSDGILINGLLNIEPPNNNIPNKASGNIIMNALYGRKFELPVEWTLNYTGKTKLEFEFDMIISKEEYEKNNIDVNDILENINFDLIRCGINTDDIDMNFLINIEPNKIQSDLEAKLEKFPKINKSITKNGLKLYKIFNKLLPINKNIAVFQSFHGKSYSCNPKAMYEELLNENKNIKGVWVLNDTNKKLPGNPIVVKPRSIQYYYYMAIGKYFINNGNFPDFYEKREGTVHLQTWHGTPLKKLGFDISPQSPAYAENTSPELMNRNKRWDYLIAPNEYTGDILKRAFKFENELLSVGYPRNDVLFRKSDDKIEEIKKKLNISKDKKVILYAPTWRDYEFHSGSADQPYEFKFDIDRFKNELGDDYVLLLRLHYRDANRINISGYENIVYNVSTYDDIQELYLISDILITDYSSVMFDYANLNRPIIFFAYDLKRYGSEVRGFYFDFLKEAPGPIVLDQDSLFESIKDIENTKINYKDRYERFREKFCKLEDGQASIRTIKRVFKEN